ncbi:MAG: hypothetical protein NC548_22765 [Lachnospiraceae bacterium]|nr:hypothetical protein [Lachnospiraceae bacterium]
MRFSLNYKSKYKNEADELRCPVNQLGTIFQFIKDNPDKRYNIIVNDLDHTNLDQAIAQVEFVKAVAQDYTIQSGSIPILKSFINAGYNSYLRFPIADWESFQALKSIGVSDIYIDGPLGFQCDNLQQGKENVLIRCSPTVSPNAAILDTKSASSFFIRPEDLSLYSALDIIDFKMDDQEKEDTLFKIYKRGTFNFDLRQLVEGLDIKAPNIFIRKEFAEARLNCGQRCRVPNRSCHLCETQLTLTNTLLEYMKETN